MRKSKKRKIATILLSIFVMTLGLSLAGCGSESKERTLHGSYHTEANGYKRGVDLDITMEGDTMVATIIDDMDSEYSLTDPDTFQNMWPVKQTPLIQNVQDMGIEGIKGIKVTLDDQGIPTAVDGIEQEWVPDGCMDCAGMVILAMQDALKDE